MTANRLEMAIRGGCRYVNSFSPGLSSLTIRLSQLLGRAARFFTSFLHLKKALLASRPASSLSLPSEASLLVPSTVRAFLSQMLLLMGFFFLPLPILVSPDPNSVFIMRPC